MPLSDVDAVAVAAAGAEAGCAGGWLIGWALRAGSRRHCARRIIDPAVRARTAYRGEDKFKGNKVPLKTLMILYPNRMHEVTVEGRGIARMADLKGKRAYLPHCLRPTSRAEGADGAGR